MSFYTKKLKRNNYTFENNGGGEGDDGIRGLKGDKGPQGLRGHTGPPPNITFNATSSVPNGTAPSISVASQQGANVVLDCSLETGAKGDDGNTPSVQIGTTTTINSTMANPEPDATVSITTPNTEEPWVIELDFGIPQGKQGEKGDDGDEGPRGPAGATGSTGATGASTAAAIAAAATASAQAVIATSQAASAAASASAANGHANNAETYKNQAETYKNQAHTSAQSLNSYALAQEGPEGPPGEDGTDGTNGTNGTNGTDGTSFSVNWANETYFTSQSDFMSKMNLVYGNYLASTTSGGGSSGGTSTSTLSGTNYDIRWTNTNAPTDWKLPGRSVSTFSQSKTSGTLYDVGLVPFVEDMISKIQSATENTGTLNYNSVNVSPYYVWNNAATNVLNLHASTGFNFGKISIRIYIPNTTSAEIQIISWISDSNPWGYWKKSISKSGGTWSGDFINSSNAIGRTAVPVPSAYLTTFSQFTN